MTDSETLDPRNAVTATTDRETGDIEASAVFDTAPERLFRALTTKEICNWWVRPGVFNTQEWSGDVREGGRWAAAGIGGGQPYQLEGSSSRSMRRANSLIRGSRSARLSIRRC